MTNNPDVFVYGATGYTGRLICQELINRGITFTMGGRNIRRLETFREELKDTGIKVVQVTHDVEALTHSFRGHTVVINATGPFSLLGETVVKAALAAEAHYLDTTGEQDFMLLVKERYDGVAKKLKRVFINANSWYYSLGESAAAYLHEKFPALDTFKIFYCPAGQPTVASLQSVFRVITHSGFYFISGKLKKINKVDVILFSVPGEAVIRKAIPICGSEAIHFASEKGIKNVQVFFSPEKPYMIPFVKFWKNLARVFGKALDPLTDWLVGRFWKTPPPEEPSATRFIVMAAGEGENERKICVLFGSRPYVVTSFMCGEAVERLLQGNYKQTGVISTPQAFGAKEILEALKKAGVSYRVYE